MGSVNGILSVTRKTAEKEFIQDNRAFFRGESRLRQVEPHVNGVIR